MGAEHQDIFSGDAIHFPSLEERPEPGTEDILVLLQGLLGIKALSCTMGHEDSVCCLYLHMCLLRLSRDRLAESHRVVQEGKRAWDVQKKTPLGVCSSKSLRFAARWRRYQSWNRQRQKIFGSF